MDVPNNLVPVRDRRPMRKLPAQRVAVLIDDDNLSITAAKLFGRRIDYARLLEAIDDRELFRAILYRPEAAEEKHRFPVPLADFLDLRLGIEVKTPPKNVDCWLTVDAIALSTHADVIALVGGDGDYEPLVHHVKAKGVKVEVWSWWECTSRRLREAADRYVPLTEDMLLPARVAEAA